MGLFDFLKTETRSGEMTEKSLDLTLRNGFSEVAITKKEALNIPAVAASVDFIAGTLASIPIKLYRKNLQNGNKEEVTDDYRLGLLNSETGDLLDAYQMKKSMVSDYLLDGRGYAYIKWLSNNTIASLHYIDDRQVSVLKNEDPIFKKADFIVTGRVLEESSMLRICKDTTDGVTGVGVIDKHSTLLKSMYNSLKYESKSLATGTKKGFLKSSSRLQEPQVKELKEAYRQLFRDDTSDTMILNGGISFEGVSATAAELQQNENKVTNTSDVYSIFGINDDLFTVSSSSKDAYINSIKTAVFPVIAALEAAFNRFLLLDNEKNSMFFAFDTKAIMKGDILNRYKAYEIATKEGFMTVDEVRKEENYAPIGLDKIKLSLGTVFYDPETAEIFNINTNSIISTEGGVKDESGDTK